MTFPELAPFITSISSLIAAVGVVWNLRATKQVVKQTNHIKDELVAEVRKASFAAGKKDEKDSPS
jgi:hypothetical protein